MATARGDGVQSVSRALDVLEALEKARGPLGVTELATTTGLPAPTIHRLAATLVARGFLRQSADRRYSLGSRLTALGASATALLGARVQPLLTELARTLGESVNLAVLAEPEAEYVAQAAGLHSIRMFTEVGRRVPLHSTGVGKALLSLLPDRDAERILERTPMPRFTATTITTPERMLAELEVIRSQGFAMDEGEMEDDVRCVAVPFMAEQAMAVSVSGPTARMTDELVESARVRLAEVTPRLVAALRDERAG